jgi:hypothetical protein
MQQPTPKPVRVFTRDAPCTKVDLFNCFSNGHELGPVAVVQARGEIGVNAIKYLLGKDLARLTMHDGWECWELTSEGEAWLLEGLCRWLELHPEDRDKVKTKPGGNATPGRKVIRRTRR